MRDDFDVEDVLRRHEAGPTARVKRAVLERFAGMRGPGAKGHGFWTRPIPLYAAAAALLIVVALSFAAGRRTSPAGDQRGTGLRSAGEKDYATSAEIEWVPAENDLL